MAYNYGPPPGSYRPGQPAFPFAGTTGAPGTALPPGMEAPPGTQSQMPGSGPNPAMQQPPNMPNINFNAPVIRLGLQDPPTSKGGSAGAADRLTGGQGGGRTEGRGSNYEPLGRHNRMGLGAGGGGDNHRGLDRERAAVREHMMAIHPPTREEVARTIFIGGLSNGAPDDMAIESILRCAGKLRRWTRARDADDKLCKFGFAEYEDVDSLEAANEILPGIEVPMMGKDGKAMPNADGEVKNLSMLVVVDEQSKSYIEEWKGKSREDDDARQFRIDGCKEDLRQAITALSSTVESVDKDASGDTTLDASGDAIMTEGQDANGDNAAVVNIPLALEDDLADIPVEMRATVAEEIRAFRDRSNRRDLERLRREEELEAAERQRSSLNPRVNRLASPPPTRDAPASAANGIPVGPRDKTSIPGAPSGPKLHRGVQLPSDYVNGVAFVGANGSALEEVEDEEEDASESDDELERRRQTRKEEMDQKQYASACSRWLQRQRMRKSAQDRLKQRKEGEKKDLEREREKKLRYLREFNDDEESKKRDLEFFRDRSAWVRKRSKYREQEEREDKTDRQAELREEADEQRKTADTRGAADDFLAQTGAELEQRGVATNEAAKASTFKISLGPAAARSKGANAAAQGAPRRALADVENLLEDDDDDVDATLTGGVRARPELRPLTDTSTAPLPDGGSDLTAEERAAARQALAATVPSASAPDIFDYPVRWNYLTPQLLDVQLRPFVEDKVVECLGVQEELLVEAVLDGLRERKAAADIIAEVEGALEEDAEGLVRKTWRTVIFTTEAEARGLS